MDTRRQYNAAFFNVRSAVKSLDVDLLRRTLDQFPVLCQDATSYLIDLLISINPASMNTNLTTKVINVLATVLYPRISNNFASLKIAIKVCESVIKIRPNLILIVVKRIFQDERQDDGCVYFILACTKVLMRKPYSENDESITFLQYIREQAQLMLIEPKATTWNVVIKNVEYSDKKSVPPISTSLNPLRLRLSKQGNEIMALKSFTNRTNIHFSCTDQKRIENIIDGNEGIDKYIACLCLLFTVCPRLVIFEIRSQKRVKWVLSTLISFLANERQKTYQTNPEVWDAVMVNAYRMIPILLRVQGFKFEGLGFSKFQSVHNEDNCDSGNNRITDISILTTLRGYFDSFSEGKTQYPRELVEIHTFTTQVIQLWLNETHRSRITLTDHFEWMSLPAIKSCIQNEILFGNVVLADCICLWNTSGFLGEQCLNELMISILGNKYIMCALVRNQIACGKRSEMQTKVLHSFLSIFLNAVNGNYNYHHSFWNESETIRQYIEWYFLWRLAGNEVCETRICNNENESQFSILRRVRKMIKKKIGTSESSGTVLICEAGHVQPISPEQNHECTVFADNGQCSSEVLLTVQPPSWKVWIPWCAGLHTTSNANAENEKNCVQTACSKMQVLEQHKNSLQISSMLSSKSPNYSDVIEGIVNIYLLYSADKDKATISVQSLTEMIIHTQGLMETFADPQLTQNLFSSSHMIIHKLFALFNATNAEQEERRQMAMKETIRNSIEIVTRLRKPIRPEQWDSKTLRKEIRSAELILEQLELELHDLPVVHESMPNFVGAVTSLRKAAEKSSLSHQRLPSSLDAIRKWGADHDSFHGCLVKIFDGL